MEKLEDKTVQVTFRDGLLMKLTNASVVSYGLVGTYRNVKTGKDETTHIPFDAMKTFTELD